MKSYRLDSLPGESFTGLDLLCLLYAGRRQVPPDGENFLGVEWGELRTRARARFEGKQAGNRTRVA